MMPVAEITESDNDSFLDVTQALDGKEFIMNAILHVHPNTFRVGEVGQKNCSKAQSFRAILVPLSNPNSNQYSFLLLSLHRSK